VAKPSRALRNLARQKELLFIHRDRSKFGILLLGALLFSSCATARLNYFKQFSHAGIAYSDAVGVLLDKAGTAAIDTDSMVLTKARPQLSLEEKKAAIVEQNRLLRERLDLLGGVKRHARLLRSYFEALGTLAESDAPSGIGTAAEGVVRAMGRLHPKIENAKVGATPVSNFIGSVTNIAVAHFKVAALESELKMRAATIERELDLQQAALSAIAEELRTDLTAQLQQQESKEVVLPYVKDDPLPDDWAKRRREALRAHVSLASADAAADAAGKLKITFVALSEGRYEFVDVPALIDDINEIIALMEEVKGRATELQ
jgi:hypothetical protein